MLYVRIQLRPTVAGNTGVESLMGGLHPLDDVRVRVTRPGSLKNVAKQISNAYSRPFNYRVL